MEKRHIKPKRLAESVGMSERSLYYIFENKKCPTMCEMERFAIVLGVGIDDLYNSPYKFNRKNSFILQSTANICKKQGKPSTSVNNCAMFKAHKGNARFPKRENEEVAAVTERAGGKAMSKNKGTYYKDTLRQEVDKIPEQDTMFLIQLINMIRVHIRRTGKR